MIWTSSEMLVPLGLSFEAPEEESTPPGPRVHHALGGDDWLFENKGHRASVLRHPWPCSIGRLSTDVEFGPRCFIPDSARLWRLARIHEIVQILQSIPAQMGVSLEEEYLV